jgi:hypothetical protein
MNQKILGVIPLLVALMFAVSFVATDNPVAAADTASQTATVTVNENIAITVPTAATMSGNDGDTVTSNSYDVNNVGNVQVHIYVKANAPAFTSGGSIDTIPITGYQIKNQAGSYVTLTETLQKITTTKLNTLKHGSNVLNTDQKLAIPTGTEAANYANSLTYTAMKN